MSGELRVCGRYVCYIHQERPAFAETPEENTFEQEIDCGGGILLPLPAAGADPCEAVRRYLVDIAAADFVPPFRDAVRVLKKADLILIDLRALNPEADNSIFADGSWVIADVFRKYQRDLLQSILVKLNPSHIRLVLSDGYPLDMAS